MRIFKLLAIFLTAGFVVGFIDGAEDISNAIKTANLKQLSGYIGPNIDLTIGSKESVYSKLQAEQILKDFFSSNAPQSFSVLHKDSLRNSDPLPMAVQ